jgi:serine/threonine-protein kinase
MPDPSCLEASENERRLDEILAAFLAAEDAGQTPDLDAILVKHPDLADELRAFFQGHDRIGRLAAPLRAVAGASNTAVETTEGNAESTLAASPLRAGRPPETTETLKATVELTARWADDPEATAPVSQDATGEGDPIKSGTRVRYFGDYELFNVLGRGGMGVVYKARQLSLNRPVALKLLLSGILATEDDLRRFQNEAESVAMLDHPHIVPILEVGRYEEQRYFSMKLIGGPSLDRQLGRFTADPKAAARLVRTLAEAVHHAHQRGILHRDLKPGNVLLDERGQPHVTDFGLAKRVQADSELTQSGAIMGTPAYMAPEQASGKRGSVTTATDVYGLGAILYALLTGRAPFGGESPVETLEKVRERTPESPSKLNPRVSRDLETVCLKCLEKDPARRYSSAEALADDLRRYLSGESILARPAWLATRAWMWCRRKPVLAGLASALALALLIVVVIDGARRREAGAKRREAAVRKEAETNFMMARAAVDNYLTAISENTLLKHQDSVDIRGLRRELLSTALKYYQSFVNQRRNDARLREQLAGAYFRVGEVTKEISTPREAIAAFHSAQVTWDELTVTDPQNHEFRGHLGDCHLAIGKLQGVIDDFQAAMTSLGKARVLLEPLSIEHPEVASYQASLAECYSEIGFLQGRLKSPDRGLDMLEKARAAQQRLIDRYPGQPVYQQKLAEFTIAFGVVHFEQRDFPAALRSFQEVRSLCQSLLDGVSTGPKPVRLLDLLAISYYNISVSEVQKGQFDAALKSFEKSLEYRAALAEAHPSVTEFQARLGMNLGELAVRHHGAHQRSKAFASIRRSIDILEKLVQMQPDQPRYRSDLSRSWNILGYLQDEARENRLAIPAFERAVKEQLRVVDASPNVDDYKIGLCNQLDNLGEQFVDLGEVGDALPHYRREIKIWQDLLAAHSENRDYALKLSDAMMKLGTIERHNGDSRAARERFAEAHDVLKPAAARDPTLQGRLGAIFTCEAIAMTDLKRTDEALHLLHEAVDILSHFGTSPAADDQAREWLNESLWELARMLREMSKPREADLRDTERIALWKSRSPRELAALALRQARRAALIGYGKTPISDQARSVRELDLDQAAASLRLAISLGFKDLAMLGADPDSWILFARTDLRPLLMDLSFPAWPFDKNR